MESLKSHHQWNLVYIVPFHQKIPLAVDASKPLSKVYLEHSVGVDVYINLCTQH